MARSIWSGSITYGMLSIPVKLYPATEDKDISFHLLHKTDHSRIKQKRFCAAEDIELFADDIVRAYEYVKDDYVEITPDDLAGLPVPAKNVIDLRVTLDSHLLEPAYVEKTYWLGPEKVGVKPYVLLLEALKARDIVAVATIAIRNKEVICALRPSGDGEVIMLHTLFWPDEIRQHETPPLTRLSDAEMEMAVMLMDSLHAEEFQSNQFQDNYRVALIELIEAKHAGKPIEHVEPTPPPSPQPDIMAALRASIEKANRERGNAPPPQQFTQDGEPVRPKKGRSRRIA